jgi:hypothetical protein
MEPTEQGGAFNSVRDMLPDGAESIFSTAGHFADPQQSVGAAHATV